ncbi:hypothetical protein [Desulfosporosinus shakirovi]|uniref:hypothetical protein n=1 Tax=Desulfosporosinus shakirovi TaxID=2885154 RepID=UPI001E2C3E21|nr:hypothetical protein [Desulfosporosinus sp. SRJS8]MCB8815295.1 hypothetical protein [Desulfosporosinus sp. SRJS8]
MQQRGAGYTLRNSVQPAAGSRQVSVSSIALSQGVTEQASSIEQLTASLEEIASETKLNAENANQANERRQNSSPMQDASAEAAATKTKILISEKKFGKY